MSARSASCMCAHRRNPAEAGYTLLELLVVLAIAGLLAGAVPALFARAKPTLDSEAVTRAVVHELALARQTAVAEGVEQRVVIDASGGRMTTEPGGRTRVLPKTVPLTFGRGRGEIDFFPDGSSTSGVILVGAGRQRHRLVIHWLSGRVARDE